MVTDAEPLIKYVKEVLIGSKWALTRRHEYDVTLEQQIKWIEKHHEGLGKLLLLAEAEREIIGMLDFSNYHREIHQHVGGFGLSVRADWRQSGIGKALLQTLLDWARANPVIEKVALVVCSTNKPALQLYRQVGFVEEGRRPREYRLGKDRYVDDMLMYLFTN